MKQNVWEPVKRNKVELINIEDNIQVQGKMEAEVGRIVDWFMFFFTLEVRWTINERMVKVGISHKANHVCLVICSDNRLPIFNNDIVG